MGQITYPIPVVSAGTSYSTIPPTNASSVLLDGNLAISGTYTATITGTGGAVYYVSSPSTKVTLSGITYSTTDSIPLALPVINGATNIAIAANSNFSAPNSSTFTATSITNVNGFGSNLAYGNGTWVAINANNGTSSRSTNNGATWSAGGNLPTSGYIYAMLAYGNGVFVFSAYNSQGAYSTNNGVTWTAGGPSSSYPWENLKYVSTTTTSGFLAGATGNSYGQYSIDGISWSGTSYPYNYNWYRTASGNGYALVISNDYAACTYSTNLLTWTINATSANFAWVSDGIYFNNFFIWTTTNNGSTTTNYSYTSGNTGPFTFTTGTLPVSSMWTTISYSTSAGYIIMGGNTTTSLYSTNGFSWTTFTTLSGMATLRSNGPTFVYTPTGASGPAVGGVSQLTGNPPASFGFYNGPTALH